MDNREVLVSVFVTSYNYETLISDTLEGILNQKTTFRYEIIVHDDASTDRTQDIIREYYKKYPEIIVPVLREKNVYSYDPTQIAMAFIDNAKGKYMAICEGDDYWIDEYKLQKQIDFMESHPDYSMCFSNAWKYDVKNDKKTLLNTFPKSGTYSLEEQVKLGLGSSYPAAATYVLVTDLYKKMFNVLCFEMGTVGDYPYRVIMASYGKVYYMNEPTAVYRYCVSESFSERIKSNKDYYLRYFFEMHKVYAFLNGLLKNQFEYIYKKKNQSDYLGLASRVTLPELEDYLDSLPYEQKLSFDKELFIKCREIVDSDTIPDSLKNFIDSNIDNIYLYGTSILAEQIYAKLRSKNITIRGFVVSDGFGKPDEFQGEKTMYLSELANTGEKSSVILSVQPINEMSIIENINTYSNVDYYSLF